jgi:hypothetical protein
VSRHACCGTRAASRELKPAPNSMVLPRSSPGRLGTHVMPSLMPIPLPMRFSIGRGVDLGDDLLAARRWSWSRQQLVSSATVVGKSVRVKRRRDRGAKRQARKNACRDRGSSHDLLHRKEIRPHQTLGSSFDPYGAAPSQLLSRAFTATARLNMVRQCPAPRFTPL